MLINHRRAQGPRLAVAGAPSDLDRPNGVATVRIEYPGHAPIDAAVSDNAATFTAPDWSSRRAAHHVPRLARRDGQGDRAAQAPPGAVTGLPAEHDRVAPGLDAQRHHPPCRDQRFRTQRSLRAAHRPAASTHDASHPLPASVRRQTPDLRQRARCHRRRDPARRAPLPRTGRDMTSGNSQSKSVTAGARPWRSLQFTEPRRNLPLRSKTS
jgi:hypothetical protein